MSLNLYSKNNSVEKNGEETDNKNKEERYQASTVNTYSTKNPEIKINEDYNGNISHSLKNTNKDNNSLIVNSGEMLDKSEIIGYMPMTRVEMKTFPPYNESKSGANEWSTRWVHRHDVENGA